MGNLKTVAALLSLIALTTAWPRRGRSGEQAGSFIGEATNELSSAIFQSYVDDDSNLAFSPLGYSVILAILAEGAHGETRNQLTTALKLPNDSQKVRNMYQGIMQRLNQTNQYKLNTPEFKNWFYVYKNYTVNDDYRKILETFYLTEVKSVERYDSSFFQIKKESSEKNKEEEQVKQINPMPSVEIKEPVTRDLSLKENSKDVINFEELKDKENKEEDKQPQKKKTEKEDNKAEESKTVESKQLEDEKIITFAMEDKPEKVESELYDKTDLVKPGKSAKDKTKLANNLSKKSSEIGSDYEIMEAVEARTHARRAKSLFGKNDVSNSLSANRVGSTNLKDPNSLMILFNGLYFRGSWKTPLVPVNAGSFYKTPTEKKQVPLMEVKGVFRTGSLPGLDSVAVELPYEGGRYALVVVAPRARAGLRRLVADLPGLPPSRLSAMLSPRQITVRLPSFYVEVTTKPLAALAKFGVSSIFSPEADLSGISPVSGLFVQEMVQHVSVKVDLGGNSQAQLSASQPVAYLERSQPLKEESDTKESTKGVPEEEEFIVDRPFLFFVMDVVDNIVVLAGKVTDPQEPEVF